MAPKRRGPRHHLLPQALIGERLLFCCAVVLLGFVVIAPFSGPNRLRRLMPPQPRYGSSLLLALHPHADGFIEAERELFAELEKLAGDE